VRVNKIFIGIGLGAVAGVINALFLTFAQDIEWTVYLSTIITWIVCGFFISSSALRINGIRKGILIAILISIPSLIYVLSANLVGAVWTIMWTILFGGIIGFLIEKIDKK